MAAMISKAWTPEDDRRLLELEKAGRPRSHIAVALRRTTTAVQSRLYTLRKEAKRAVTENAEDS